MQKNLLYTEKISTPRTASKNPEKISKNRKIFGFSKFDPYGFNFEFFRNFLHSKNT